MLNECKNFSIKKEGKLSSATLSLIDNKCVSRFIKINSNDIWYYFNRLYVHPEIRNQGIATLLLKQVTVWADENKINILNEINPYGDLNLDNLILLYSKFGFKRVKKCKNLMIRYYKKKNKYN